MRLRRTQPEPDEAALWYLLRFAFCVAYEAALCIKTCAMFGLVPRLQATVAGLPFINSNSYLKGFCEHPAGPFTIHFWAPTAKWLISAANIADVNRPVEKMSKPQQAGAFWVFGAKFPLAHRTPHPSPPSPRSRGGHGHHLGALLHANYPRELQPSRGECGDGVHGHFPFDAVRGSAPSSAGPLGSSPLPLTPTRACVCFAGSSGTKWKPPAK